LFIDMISKRYQKTKFVIITKKKIKNKNFEENIKIIYQGKILTIIDKIIKLVSLKNNNLENILMKKCDATVLIGGSMFIEKDMNDTKKRYFIGGGKEYFILGVNFGPYKSVEYKEKFLKVFKNASDVCFREKESYKLFNELSNSRVKPDIIFGYDMSKYIKSSGKHAVFSIIDCELRPGLRYKKSYEKLILDLIEKFSSIDYKITLMSFCKNEGDEKAIESIIKKINNIENKKIDKYFYNGNIDEALKIIGESQIIVGSRFHANILGLVMNKSIIPVAYSDKTINTLKDINYKGKIIDIRKTSDSNISDIIEENMNYKLNVNKYVKTAQEQFEKLDIFLNQKI